MTKDNKPHFIISNEGTVLNVCSTKKIAEQWRDLTLFGYYSDCKVKPVTENIEYWTEQIDDTIENLKDIS